MRIFVGLDCGGTTSRALAVDESGEAVFRGQGGPANLLATPPPVLERSLRRATEGCPEPAAVCGAFAGLVGEGERDRATDLLQAIFPAAAICVEPDYAAAHAAAPAGTDVTVIAGTGSLVCGRDATSGCLLKTGGGGYLLGDEGSGFRYGRAALAHYVQCPESRSDTLTEAVARHLGKVETGEVVAALYAAPSPQALLARLLPAFAADLDACLPYAEATAERETNDLASLVARHVETCLHDRTAIRVALAGGVWKASGGFKRAFETALSQRLPSMTVDLFNTVRPPVEGAVALAREHTHGNGK